MDAARTLLDRELLLSGIVHEMRGSLTAVKGYAEMDEGRLGPVLGSATARLASLVAALADTTVAPPQVVTFRGVPVKLSGPLEVLELALAGLPHVAASMEIASDHVALTLHGVPAAEVAAGWSLAQVRTWLAEGGPGFAGARLRIAARVIGALRYTFPLSAGSEAGSVTIFLARG